MGCLQKPVVKIILGTLAFWLLAIIGSTSGSSTCAAHAQAQVSPRTATEHSRNDPRLVTRGKYIVEDVAICTQCHTPHTSSAELDRSRWLEGSALWLQPASPDPLAASRSAACRVASRQRRGFGQPLDNRRMARWTALAGTDAPVPHEQRGRAGGRCILAFSESRS
jgi:hypothetical protein